MKNAVVYTLALVIATAPLMIIPACNKSTTSSDDLVGNWVIIGSYDGYARYEAVQFTINDKAYVGLGVGETERYADFYYYDVDNGFWTSVASFPGATRNSAVAFAAGGKGYVTTGYDGQNYLKDTWQYDPAGNAWQRLTASDFPGAARRDAVAFAVGTKGYVGTGYNGNYLNDFYEFNSADGTWAQRPSVPGNKRAQSTAFVVNNLGYICSGEYNGAAQNDLLVYDPGTKVWTAKRKLTNVSDESYDDKYSNIIRYNGVSFVLDNKAYVTTGENGSLNSSTWEYNAADDTWTEKTTFSGNARTGAVAFTIKSRGFVAVGRSGSLPYENFYEFQPAADDNDDDNN